MSQQDIFELSDQAIKLTRLAVQTVFGPLAKIKEPNTTNSVPGERQTLNLASNVVVSIEKEEGQLGVVCSFEYCVQNSIQLWKPSKVTLSNGETTVVFHVVTVGGESKLLTWAQMEQNLSIARRLELYSKYDFEYSKKQMYTHR